MNAAEVKRAAHLPANHSVPLRRDRRASGGAASGGRRRLPAPYAARRAARLASVVAFTAACAGFLTGCPALFYVPLRITASSPAQAVYAAGEQPAVWVEFSAAVDEALAEQAFSLSRDGDPLAGRFSWNGARLTFAPYEAFAAGHEYVLKVDTSVEDACGNSLERDFIFRFRFGTDDVRPFVVDAYPSTAAVDCDPYDHEVLASALPADLYHPVTVVFSEPVDRASFYGAFSLSPAVPGRFDWPTDATAVFVPAEPYEWQTEYEVKIGTGLKDLAGNGLAKAYSSHFFIGTDRTPPAVGSVTSVIPSPGRQGAAPEAPVALQENRAVGGWEADWDVLVQFTEPVTEDSVTTAFVFTPALDYQAVFDPLAPDRVVLKRPDARTRFRYGQTYALQVKSGVSDLQGNKTTNAPIYYFTVDGPYTKPPAVLQVYHLADVAENLAPGWDGTWHWTPLHPLDTLAIQDGAATPYRTSAFDLYFTCAQRVTLTVASFAENFKIAYENGCIGVPVFTSIRVITPADAATAFPPLPAGVTLAPDQIVVRVCVQLVDTSNGGTLTLTLGDKFADQSLDNPALHNPLTADWSLRLRDPN
jgi:hypothetical protein